MNPSIGIDVLGVKKRLKKTQALDGVTSFFDPGMLHGVIGPDGAGKTTLLRTMMGLLSPDEGQIVFSQDQNSVSFDQVRPLFAYLPQQQSLYPDLSCSEHLEFFRDLYRIPKEIYKQRRDELLHLARLEKFKDRAAGQLSGGMYKKLGLICVLLQSPWVLFLDEPTTGVDPISRRELWDLLYRLLKENVLIVLTTAYMDEAERCGKVHLMDSGSILAKGEPRELLEKEGVANFGELFSKRLHRGS